MNDKALVALAIEYDFGCDIPVDARYPDGAIWYDGNPLPMLRRATDAARREERTKILLLLSECMDNANENGEREWANAAERMIDMIENGDHNDIVLPDEPPTE